MWEEFVDNSLLTQTKYFTAACKYGKPKSNVLMKLLTKLNI